MTAANSAGGFADFVNRLSTPPTPQGQAGVNFTQVPPPLDALTGQGGSFQQFVDNNPTGDTSIKKVSKGKYYQNAPDLRKYRPTYVGSKYKLPPVDGSSKSQLFTRATTVGKALDETGNLDKWKIRTTLKGVAKHPHLIDDIDLTRLRYSSHALDKDLDEIYDSAFEAAGGGDAARLGTAVHSWTEFIDWGEGTLSDVPADQREFLDAYVYAMLNSGVKVAPNMIERIVFNPITQSVGTLDRIYIHPLTGEWVIGDVKTTKSLNYGWMSIAIQLSQYATATHMLSLDGTRWEPMPKVSQTTAIVAHIPSSGDRTRGIVCDMVEFNIKNGIEAMLLAAQVTDARSRSREFFYGGSLWEYPDFNNQEQAIEYTPTAPTTGTTSLLPASRVEEDNPVGFDNTTMGPSKPVSSFNLLFPGESVTDAISRHLAAATTVQEVYGVGETFKNMWTPQHTNMGNQRLQELANS